MKHVHRTYGGRLTHFLIKCLRLFGLQPVEMSHFQPQIYRWSFFFQLLEECCFHQRSLDNPTVCALRCSLFKEEQGPPLVFRARTALVRTFTATITQVVFIQGIGLTHRRQLLHQLN